MLDASWFADSCKDITSEHKKIWVAYSGGVDSHVLLLLASLSLPNVQAIHINHGLSPNADFWQQHCELTCAALNIKLHCIKVNAKPKPKQSPEDAARIARRNAWQKLLNADDILLLAHHADDQAETILYRLFRGTGPKGMSGMARSSKIGAALIFRPLLNINKQDILNFAQTENLKHITDESNANSKYDRNFIRNQIMPLLQNRWPAVTDNINRAGFLNSQLLHCLEPILAEKLSSVFAANNCELDISKLKKHSEIWQTEIIRAWLQGHGITPCYKQIVMLKDQVVAAGVDANPIYVILDKTVRRSSNKLYVLDTEQKTEEFIFESVWDFNDSLNLPNGKVLNIDQVSTNSDFIAKLSMSQVTVKLGAHGAKAKKIFQKYSVPSWERMNYPLVFADGRLVAIAGLWSSSRFLQNSYVTA